MLPPAPAPRSPHPAPAPLPTQQPTALLIPCPLLPLPAHPAAPQQQGHSAPQLYTGMGRGHPCQHLFSNRAINSSKRTEVFKVRVWESVLSSFTLQCCG